MSRERISLCLLGIMLLLGGLIFQGSAEAVPAKHFQILRSTQHQQGPGFRYSTYRVDGNELVAECVTDGKNPGQKKIILKENGHQVYALTYEDQHILLPMVGKIGDKVVFSLNVMDKGGDYALAVAKSPETGQYKVYADSRQFYNPYKKDKYQVHLVGWSNGSQLFWLMHFATKAEDQLHFYKYLMNYDPAKDQVGFEEFGEGQVRT